MHEYFDVYTDVFYTHLFSYSSYFRHTYFQTSFVISYFYNIITPLTSLTIYHYYFLIYVSIALISPYPYFTFGTWWYSPWFFCQLLYKTFASEDYFKVSASGDYFKSKLTAVLNP